MQDDLPRLRLPTPPRSWSATLDGTPCPYCDLPASAAREILAARRRSADAELTAKYTEVVKRIGKAEGEASRLRDAVEEIRQVLEGLDRERPS